MKIKYWLYFLILTLFMPIVSAQENTINALVVRYPLILDGQDCEIRNPMYLINNYTYLPLREIGELFNLYIAWDNAEKTINISNIGMINEQEKNMLHMFPESAVVSATLSDFSIKLNGYQIQAQQPIVVIQNNAYLPLRQLAELLQITVDWNPQQKNISMKSAPAPEPEEKDIYLWYSDTNGLDSLYGLMDKTGHIITPPKYNFIGHFSEGLAIVEKEGNYGYIDTNGVEIIPCQYYYAGDFSEGLAMVSKNNDGHPGLFSFINTDGNTVIDEKFYNEPGHGVFQNGLAPVKIQENGKYYYCYIDKTGEIKAKYPTYEIASEIGNFQDGYARLDDDIINTDFEVVFRGGEYDSFELHNGWIVVCKNNRYGVVDLDNNIIIDFQYEKLKSFSEGLFAFYENGLWGYIDINNQVVIPASFQYASEFFDGKAIVETEPGVYRYIDKKGTFLSKEIYAQMCSIVNDCGLFFINDSGHFFSKTGDIIEPKIDNG